MKVVGAEKILEGWTSAGSIKTEIATELIEKAKNLDGGTAPRRDIGRDSGS